jgi:hypothetical protein
MVPNLDRGSDKEYLATINLKAVDVQSGRALWLYQNSVVEVYGENGLKQQKMFFRAPGTRAPGPEAKTGVTNGGFFLLEGVLLGGVGVPLALFAPGPLDTIGTVSTIVAAASVATGIILLVRGEHPYPKEVPPVTYATPEDVLCIGEPSWLKKNDDDGPKAAPGATPQASSSYSFGQATAAAQDPARERSQRLAQKITLDFVGALKSVASGH